MPTSNRHRPSTAPDQRSAPGEALRVSVVVLTYNWPEALRLGVTTDVHSPVRWRVLGPVADFPEFRKAFSCEAAPAGQAPTAIW